MKVSILKISRKDRVNVMYSFRSQRDSKLSFTRNKRHFLIAANQVKARIYIQARLKYSALKLYFSLSFSLCDVNRVLNLNTFALFIFVSFRT